MRRLVSDVFVFMISEDWLIKTNLLKLVSAVGDRDTKGQKANLFKMT